MNFLRTKNTPPYAIKRVVNLILRGENFISVSIYNKLLIPCQEEEIELK